MKLQELARIDKVHQAIATVRNIQDARNLLIISEGLLASAKKNYKGSSIASEVKEDRDRAYQTALRASEIRLLVEAKLGELLVELDLPKRERTLDGKFQGNIGVTLDSIGLTKMDSSRYQKVANYKHLIPDIIEKAKEFEDLPTRRDLERLINKPHVSHATGENEWYTPLDYMKAVHSVMGSIDVDPASTEDGNRMVRAKIFYTKEDNGLDKAWEGNVFMNPPYEQPLIAKFCHAFVKKLHLGEIKKGCVIVNNATETNWFQELSESCVVICFPKGRIKFLDKEMKPGTPLQGQAILYFGCSYREFKRIFSQFGEVLLY